MSQSYLLRPENFLFLTL